jgi:hypothetical protein
MNQMTSRCGYEVTDIRKSLRAAVERREARAAQRWTAELIATDAALGSLWAAYWLSWAAAQGAGDPNPVLPILLHQSWQQILNAAERHVNYAATPTEGWVAFRNDPAVRRIGHETTLRLLFQARQTPVIWPSKELILFDVSCMRDSPVPTAADSAPVLQVWQRDAEAMELRLMAGRWLAALQSGELRAALSAVAWTLLPTAAQSLPLPLRVAERGPAELPAKARTSSIWFWLELGKAVLLSPKIQNLHRGWITLHNAVATAFATHWKRWTASDRMRILLAWNLQIRAALQNVSVSWEAAPVSVTQSEMDLPYREIATEMAWTPMQGIVPEGADAATGAAKKKDAKKEQQARIESKLAETDAAVLAAMGLSEDS